MLPTKIRIVSRPQGEAPEWVRDAWIGCELACLGNTCGHTPAYCGGIVTGAVTKVTGFDVEQVHAIQTLLARNPQAGAWFLERGYPTPGECFRFVATCAKVLERREITGPVIMYDDMETGTMRPMPLDD